MTQSDLARRLNEPQGRPDALLEIARLVSDGSELEAVVRAGLVALALTPRSIADTRLFATVLVDGRVHETLPVLVDIIAASQSDDEPYLTDYLYALGILLDEHEGPPGLQADSFGEKLGRWMLESDGGELSWKAGIVLSNIRTMTAFAYMRRGVADRELFHNTRVWCLTGLVNGCGPAELPFLRSLIDESDERPVQEAIANAIAWLEDPDEPDARTSN